MHILYTGENPEFWINFYKTSLSEQPQYQLGSNSFNVFRAATPYQRGYGIGNLFKGLAQLAFPVLTSVGKTVGKQALATGAHVLSDVISGRNAKDAILDHGKTAATKLLKKAATNLSGDGIGFRPRRKRSIKALVTTTSSVRNKRHRRAVGSKKTGVVKDIFQAVL